MPASQYEPCGVHSNPNEQEGARSCEQSGGQIYDGGLCERDRHDRHQCQCTHVDAVEKGARRRRPPQARNERPADRDEDERREENADRSDDGTAYAAEDVADKRRRAEDRPGVI